MSDIVKIIAKTALIALITAGILAIFNNIQIPSLDYYYFTIGVRRALAIIYHWIPGANILIPFAITLLGVNVAILSFQLVAIAYRWIMKVNE